MIANIRCWWQKLPVGTKSVLVGAHCWFIHPWFVATAWWQLYGFPWDLRLWAAFVVHDLGYWSLPNMDGPEGETHVEWGARLMTRLFGPAWGDFCRYHSRFYAKRDGKPFSRLCVADKLAIALTPAWLYLPMARLSGEIEEYLAHRKEGGKYASEANYTPQTDDWYYTMQAYVRDWVAEHKDGRADTWTPIVQQDAEVTHG